MYLSSRICLNFEHQVLRKLDHDHRGNTQAPTQAGRGNSSDGDPARQARQNSTQTHLFLYFSFGPSVVGFCIYIMRVQSFLGYLTALVAFLQLAAACKHSG